MPACRCFLLALQRTLEMLKQENINRLLDLEGKELVLWFQNKTLLLFYLFIYFGKKKKKILWGPAAIPGWCRGTVHRPGLAAQAGGAAPAVAVALRHRCPHPTAAATATYNLLFSLWPHFLLLCELLIVEFFRVLGRRKRHRIENIALSDLSVMKIWW